MTAKGTNYTLGEDSTTWLTYTMENFLTIMPYPLGLLVTIFILYHPLILALLVVYIGAIYMNLCKAIGKLPDDPNCKHWKKNWYIHATVATVLGKVLHEVPVHDPPTNLDEVNLPDEDGTVPQPEDESSCSDIKVDKPQLLSQEELNDLPVIPFFTKNIREAYQVYGNIGPMRWLYERTRALVFPLMGPFPVKLRTHIGEPIPYDPNVTAEELFEKVKAAVETLRDKHQKIPGSISSALWERFTVHRKEE